jgi:hypothetical protein
MSSVKRMLFGTNRVDPGAVDTTAAEFRGLRQPLTQQMLQMMQNPAVYGGQFAAGMTGGEGAAIQNVNSAAGQVGQMDPTAMAGLMTGASGMMNPYAGLNGMEQFGINRIAQQAFGPSGQMNQANAFLGSQLNGQMNPFAGAAGLGAGEQMGLNAIQNTAFGPQGALQTQNQDAMMRMVMGGGMNPYGQQLMDANTRQITDAMSDEALKMRGMYTGAGQQINSAGSSPFAQASARLANGTANAIGDSNARLGASLFDTQQQSQLAAMGMAQQQPGLQLQNQMAATQALGLPREIAQLGMNNQANAFGQMQQNQFNAAGLTDQFSGNALQRALAGLNAAGTGAERQGAAFENAANRQVDASSQMGQLGLAQQQAQLQAQMQNLQAQGLPRMIEQLGIEGGLAQFNQQQQQMQQLMALMGQMSGNMSAHGGMAAQGGMIQDFVGGLGQGFGQALSDRRLKRDIQFAGKTPNGTNVYRYRYMNDDETRLGVMADEVEHIPGAVIRNSLGVAMVDYNKVMAHG